MTTTITPPAAGPNVDRATEMLCVIWTLLSISTLVVLVRFFVKLKVTRRLWWDDWMLVWAEMFGYLHAISLTVASKTGFGRHMKYIDSQDLSATLRAGYYSFAGAFLSPLFGRLSFCLFLLSLIWHSRRIPRWPLYVVMVTQVIVNVTSAILIYAQCGTHLSALWTFNVPEVVAHCWNFKIQTDWGYLAGYDLVGYVEWGSIELNVVIIASSIPLLRPLFKKNGLSRVLQREITEMPDSDSVALRPSQEKESSATRTESISSQEHIFHSRADPFIIQRTVEVDVSYSSEDRSLAHAALIGLPLD
ncbi:hypothetical protein ANO11243_072190 [Dothideomycetidae sp. 11243]|nr:hypothetical protein ANO11243_072190 [fungal sp. No.11243]